MLFILFCITQMKCCKRITHNYGHSWVGLQNHWRSIITTHRCYTQGYTTIVRCIHTHTCACSFSWHCRFGSHGPPLQQRKQEFTVTLIEHISLGGDLHSSTIDDNVGIDGAVQKLALPVLLNICVSRLQAHTHTRIRSYMHAHIHTMLAKTYMFIEQHAACTLDCRPSL